MSHATDPTYPTARKAHGCDYCGGAIPRGQRYVTWCWMDGGSASTVKAHMSCNDIANAYYDAGNGIDGRIVSTEPLLEWALARRDHPGLAWALEEMRVRLGWPDGEVERLALVLG